MTDRRRRRPVAEINVVPYVDVMLVLLVIFMITAPLLTTGVDVNLPDAKAKTIEAKDKPPLVVTVDQHGKYFLNVARYPKRALDEKNLHLRIAAELQRDPGRAVLVRGDRDVAYGKVVAAMVLLQQAGAPSVGLVTEPGHEVKG